MNFTDNLKETFTRGNVVIKIIYINVALFVVIAFLNVFTKLFNLYFLDTSYWFSVPANQNSLLTHFWTPITYMFYHEGFMHILFNMLMLFWFGRIFLMYYSEKQLVAVYVFGGLVGALIYFLGYNFIPYYENRVYHSILMGASGSIMAIILASAMKVPNMELQLLLIGRVKLIWIAVASVLISFFGLPSENGGGELAHLGGALAGYLFYSFESQGKDITLFVTKTIDFFVNILRPRPKIKTTRFNPSKMAPEQYNQHKAKKSKEIDQILDKIKSSGYDSLTSEEKKKLFEQK
ncbi:MAG: rhomboid family intramembrane serine protease [Paludibacter sp.]|nr:MAG: rhomboid family intramembrane serine protease [Paludibacter sp.]